MHLFLLVFSIKGGIYLAGGALAIPPLQRGAGTAGADSSHPEAGT